MVTVKQYLHIIVYNNGNVAEFDLYLHIRKSYVLNL